MSEDEQKKEDIELTPEEELQLQEYIEKVGFGPSPEEKAGFYELFGKILKHPDTTKAGAIDENELAAFRHLRRASVLTSLFDYPMLTEFLRGEGEVITSSSLSGSKRKPGAFLQALITQKRELSSETKKEKKTGGLFAKKDENE